MEIQNECNIVESRFEVMKSFSNFHTETRFAHFLMPSVNSPDGEQPDFPSNSIFSPNPNAQNKISLIFNGWKHPQIKWTSWYEKMQRRYQQIWEEAGIHNAIKNSTFKIHQDENLIIGFAERWCSKTQSFVFPWGETTITLEDVMILGGYPLTGNLIFDQCSTEETSSYDRLEEGRKRIVISKSKKATSSDWYKEFMDTGSEVEHEAFLSLWLTRFVFPTTCDSVVPSVFPIAIRLAKGERIALGPPVLAQIYRCLKLVKTNMGQDNGVTKSVTTWAPFHLLQLWVWERFQNLRPQPNFVENGEPRLARWDNKERKTSIEDVRFFIDSAAETFCWRPYVAANNNPVTRLFYRDIGESLIIGNSIELESFARCLRACELVGMERKIEHKYIAQKYIKHKYIEQYLPHRVAMQFGLDQDIPGHVEASRDSEIALMKYMKRIGEGGRELFFPSRANSAITHRYFDWWWKPSMRTDL